MACAACAGVLQLAGGAPGAHGTPHGRAVGGSEGGPLHGDLHLRNMVLLDGHPTLFDGVEYNDEIACVDVLYDLAAPSGGLRRPVARPRPRGIARWPVRSLSRPLVSWMLPAA